jgi:hypothetical protein
MSRKNTLKIRISKLGFESMLLVALDIGVMFIMIA